MQTQPSHLPPPLPSRFYVKPYLPLFAVCAEIVWLVVLLAGFCFVVGDMPMKHGTPEQERARNRVMDIVAMLPALAGLISGIIGFIRRWPRLTREWVCMILGSAGCALFVFSFGFELISGG